MESQLTRSSFLLTTGRQASPLGLTTNCVRMTSMRPFLARQLVRTYGCLQRHTSISSAFSFSHRQFTFLNVSLLMLRTQAWRTFSRTQPLRVTTAAGQVTGVSVTSIVVTQRCLCFTNRRTVFMIRCSGALMQRLSTVGGLHSRAVTGSCLLNFLHSHLCTANQDLTATFLPLATMAVLNARRRGQSISCLKRMEEETQTPSRNRLSHLVTSNALPMQRFCTFGGLGQQHFSVCTM